MGGGSAIACGREGGGVGTHPRLAVCIILTTTSIARRGFEAARGRGSTRPSRTPKDGQAFVLPALFSLRSAFAIGNKTVATRQESTLKDY